MATIFYEPSTRTRFSFESAMLRLGGKVISTENAGQFSSAAKGESLEDTIRIIDSYCDIIILRHNKPGASEIAGKHSKVPVINAGDGEGEHPTQALLDLFTIENVFPKHFQNDKPNSKLTISMIGDLTNGRTIHSLSYLLSLYSSIKINFVSPKALSIPQNLRKYLKDKKIKFSEFEDFKKGISEADVIYQTRIQKERFKNITSYKKYYGKYILDKSSLKFIKKTAIIMHPLPRLVEIDKNIDIDPRAYYFNQAQNGLYVRMALLLLVFDKV